MKVFSACNVGDRRQISNLEVGDTVIAIGNPFGLSDTMTTGIVGGIGRSIPISVGGFSIPNAIQTDTPLDPGNSG